MHFQIDKQTNLNNIVSQAKKMIRDACQDENIISEFTTIVSEIVYNMVKFSSRGKLELTLVKGKIIIEATDDGSGFSHSVENVLKEGYSTAGTLGLGIPSIIRMCDDITIKTSQAGTIIQCTKEFNYA